MPSTDTMVASVSNQVLRFSAATMPSTRPMTLPTAAACSPSLSDIRSLGPSISATGMFF